MIDLVKDTTMNNDDAQLAANTTEASSVVARDGVVFKALRPAAGLRGMSASARRRQLRLRCAESQIWPELNPMLFDSRRNVIISPLVEGEKPMRRQVRELIEHFRRTKRGYLADVGKHNVIVRAEDRRMVVIDFEIDEDHPHWKARKPAYDDVDEFREEET